MTDGFSRYGENATTDEEKREIAAKIFELLRAKSQLERCHWNVAEFFDPILGRANLTNAAWRACNAARMLSTVGAFLENVADFGAEATGIGPRPSRALALRDDMRRECTKAASAFGTLVVPEFWHPESDVQEMWQDDSIRKRWQNLCDLVCGVADVEPSYGLLTQCPERTPLPARSDRPGRFAIFARRREDDGFDELLLTRARNTW